jgi:hypothetical protein
VTEPTYEFVKGQGWVPFNNERVITMSCGTCVKLEYRLPDNGERWDSGTKVYWGGTEPDWDRWIEHFKAIEYDDLCNYTPRETLPESDFVIVAVPV